MNIIISLCISISDFFRTLDRQNDKYISYINSKKETDVYSKNDKLHIESIAYRDSLLKDFSDSTDYVFGMSDLMIRELDLFGRNLNTSGTAPQGKAASRRELHTPSIEGS